MSRLVKGCCFLTWFVLPGFRGYLAGFVFRGVASTLRSGTAESVLHDTLSAAGAATEFKRIPGRAVAPITSVAGMGQEVVGMLLYLPVGASASMMDWRGGVAVLGILALALCVDFVSALRH